MKIDSLSTSPDMTLLSKVKDPKTNANGHDKNIDTTPETSTPVPSTNGNGHNKNPNPAPVTSTPVITTPVLTTPETLTPVASTPEPATPVAATNGQGNDKNTNSAKSTTGNAASANTVSVNSKPQYTTNNQNGDVAVSPEKTNDQAPAVVATDSAETFKLRSIQRKLQSLQADSTSSRNAEFSVKMLSLKFKSLVVSTFDKSNEINIVKTDFKQLTEDNNVKPSDLVVKDEQKLNEDKLSVFNKQNPEKKTIDFLA